MKTDEFFQKILLEKKEDLPEKEDNYFCCRSGFETVQHLNPNLPEKSYQREISWYLQPVPKKKEHNRLTVARDFIRAANVLTGIVYAKEGGVIYLDSFLADFVKFIETYEKDTKRTDGLQP